MVRNCHTISKRNALRMEEEESKKEMEKGHRDQNLGD
jgi:hypothetical protein